MIGCGEKRRNVGVVVGPRGEGGCVRVCRRENVGVVVGPRGERGCVRVCRRENVGVVGGPRGECVWGQKRNVGVVIMDIGQSVVIACMGISWKGCRKTIQSNETQSLQTVGYARMVQCKILWQQLGDCVSECSHDPPLPTLLPCQHSPSPLRPSEFVPVGYCSIQFPKSLELVALLYCHENIFGKLPFCPA